ncbi:hypothetical protein DA2_2503 [Desulfovibrio sp. A2]|nr:hypothetical protein DA2_2503 [Desulfovibrio sp. A2]
MGHGVVPPRRGARALRRHAGRWMCCPEFRRAVPARKSDGAGSGRGKPIGCYSVACY